MSDGSSPKHARHEEENSLSKPKRQKVTIACDECRARKTKCDGVRPVCHPCASRRGREAQCHWGIATSRGGGISKDYVMRLEDRLRELEGNPNSTLSPNSQTEVITGVNLGSYKYKNATQDSKSQTSFDSNFKTTRARRRPRFGGATAMMGALLDKPQTQDSFYGSSSAGSFIMQVRSVMDKKIKSPQSAHPSETIMDQVQLSMPMPEHEVDEGTQLNYVLPTREVADYLLALHWKIVHPLYPFLDKQEVQVAYQSLWTGRGSGSDEPVFLCIINVVFAIACQMSETIKVEQREASADVFFTRARELLDFDLWQAASLQSVQALLLMGQYLQSTDDPHQCWIVIGLAIRTAQSLGLHLPETSQGIISPRARELLRRVWHGCVLMDQILSMTYGRPSMLGGSDAEAVPLPKAIDDEYLSNESVYEVSQPSGLPASMDFFIQTLKLYKILYEILSSCHYRKNPSEVSFETVYDFHFGNPVRRNGGRSVLDMDTSLTAWERQLPNHLQHRAYTPTSETHFRQATILRQRLLQIRLVLLRPVLASFVNYQHSESFRSLPSTLPHRIALQCSLVCVWTAQEAIKIVHNRLPTDPLAIGPLAEWWYNVLFVYTAATVLIAARIRSAFAAEISSEALAESWSQAMQILNRYGEYSVTAKRSAATLQVLYDKIPEQYQQQEGEAHLIMQADNTPAVILNKQPNSTSQAYASSGPAWPGSNTNGMSSAYNVIEHNTFADIDNMNFAFDLNDVSWLNSIPFNL